MPPVLERDVLKQVLQLLTALRLLHWRNNTGARTDVHNGKRRFTRFGVVGLPDVLCVGPGGRLIGLEVKRPGGKLTDDQKACLDNLRAAGALAFVVRSPEELLAVLRAEKVVP